jgi:hypothetical protein
MRSDSEFRSFYHSDLLPVLESLEAERKKLIKMLYFFGLVIVGVVILSIAISFFSDEPARPVVQQSPYQNNGGPQQVELKSPGTFNGIILMAAIGGLGYFFWFTPKTKDLKRRFKEDVISKMVTFVDASLRYEPNNGIHQREYELSKIFLQRVDRFMCDDLVSGKLGETAIRFSEVHTQRRDQSGSGNEKRIEWQTLFKGIFFIADFNKHFHGQTVVLTDQAESMFGSLGTMFQKLNQSRDTLIKLEDPEFEKAFAVYGTDPVEAHYILSPALMQRIMELRKKSYGVQLSFIDSRVFIAMPIKENLFEAPIFDSLLNYLRLSKYNDHLMLAASVVEDLNLNTRIWSKV